MQQLNAIAASGVMHQYKADTGLFQMLHSDNLTSDQQSQVLALRQRIGANPTKAETVAIAEDALALLNELRTQLPGPNYSAIYGQLAAAKAEAST